ncbi:hypothetical protein BN1723_000518 [Verticillium longisporum]|uniref:ATP-dependent DNA helicase II subunit 2 n=1 Tax=Verticillium longisporum TaxID=100787 RepID=A0A0G4M5W9_VERLO|nr:hypothetical protein BN1708_012144 [Verticillium longisporum]CRK29572.1 hypothetical protein BN1723_000518 [Verticillium longisporum]
MADKQATVFIVDLGSSMADCHNGRIESDLDWSMRYVWDKISTVVAASRKTWTVGVVGLKTDETRHLLQDEEGYENISILQEIGPMSMNSLKELQDVIVPSETHTGDAVSAIVIAVDMMEKYTKALKYARKIYLITDGTGPIDGDDFEDITKKINHDGIELIVLGVDFDDAEYGFKEEDKPSLKASQSRPHSDESGTNSFLKKENERLLKDLVSKCKDAQLATIAEAIDELDTPRLKPVRPYKSYDGPLTLGDVKDPKHPSPMVINVERYFKTKLARPPPASTVVLRTEPGPSQAAEGEGMEGVESSLNFGAIRQARSYKVNDPDAPGGKRDVEFDSLAKGYEYGRTAVHISESEWNMTKIETTKAFEIVGFIPADKFEPFLSMGESCITVSRKHDDKSQLALSSLIHALYELSSYAVARIVLKDGKEPQLILLAPGIEPDLECLYDVPLPFAEDVRSYQFPPLDRVVTVSGQTLTKHRLIPDDELNDAMSDFVDAMDLDTLVKDEDGGEPTEYAPIDESYNPAIHRINQVVRDRAIKPTGDIEPIPRILLRYAEPPEDLLTKTKADMKALIKAAEVKKVPPKAKNKRNRDAAKPLSGLDIDALLGSLPKRARLVSRDNAVPEFKQALTSATDIAAIEEAASQMGEVIRGLVTDSFGDAEYNRAIEALGVMRTELINMEEPAMYNDFIKDFKTRLLAGEFGGDRREMWWRVRTGRLGLIDSAQSEVSEVTSEQAAEFLKSK